MTAWLHFYLGQRARESEQRCKTCRQHSGDIVHQTNSEIKAHEVDVAHYDRLPQGHPDRCYDYLHRCVNATIERDCLAWMPTEATRSIGGDHGTAAGAVKGGSKGGQKGGKAGDKGKSKS